MTARGKWAVRLGGFLAGIAAGVLVLAAGAVPGGTGTLGADVSFLTAPIGELDIPPGVFLRGTGMRPGPDHEVDGSVPILNQTGAAFRVLTQAQPSTRDLDGELHVSVTVGATEVFTGTLGQLSRGFHELLVLQPGERRTVAFKAWLAPDSDAYEGRIADVGLAFSVRPVEGR